MAAFAVDTASREDRVARNVLLDGEQIGGLDLTEVRSRLASSARDHGARPVFVDLGDVSVTGTAADYGFTLDTEATMSVVRDIGGEASFWERLGGWLERWQSPSHVATRFTTDPGAARRRLEMAAPALVEEPREPSIWADDGQLMLDSGEPGRRLDIDQTLAAIAAADTLDTIAGTWAPVAPQVDPGDAIARYTALKRRVEAGLILFGDGAQTFVAPQTIAAWIAAEVEGGELVTHFDEESIARTVEEAFLGFATGRLDVTYDVVDGVPMVASAADTRMVCCSDTLTAMVVSVIEGGAEGTIEIPLRPASFDEKAAAISAFGVVEEVATFTTHHRCCEGRVTNIHLIADLTQGAVIGPGESFSINEYVGERTRDKGFVDGGVIYQGEFESDVGGGISQYATTLFNAAFFAGLEFTQYQSHSLYLSRYPYGREATVSYPEPDLVIRNQTDRAVLIWPTYDDTSVTVTLYSTRSIASIQSGQEVDQSAACTRVTTHRTRTFADGAVIEDAVYAFYRPSAGYSCGALDLDEGS